MALKGVCVLAGSLSCKLGLLKSGLSPPLLECLKLSTSSTLPLFPRSLLHLSGGGAMLAFPRVRSLGVPLASLLTHVHVIKKSC